MLVEPTVGGIGHCSLHRTICAAIVNAEKRRGKRRLYNGDLGSNVQEGLEPALW